MRHPFEVDSSRCGVQCRWFKGKSPTIEEDANFLFFPSDSQDAVTANDTNRAKNDAGPRIDAVLFDYGQVLSGPPDAAAWGCCAR